MNFTSFCFFAFLQPTFERVPAIPSDEQHGDEQVSQPHGRTLRLLIEMIMKRNGINDLDPSNFLRFRFSRVGLEE